MIIIRVRWGFCLIIVTVVGFARVKFFSIDVCSCLLATIGIETEFILGLSVIKKIVLYCKCSNLVQTSYKQYMLFKFRNVQQQKEPKYYHGHNITYELFVNSRNIFQRIERTIIIEYRAKQQQLDWAANNCEIGVKGKYFKNMRIGLNCVYRTQIVN